MPVELKPTLAPPRRTSWDTGGADWHWLDQQDYYPSRIETSQGAFRRGSISGGPSYQQFLEFDDPKRWALVPPKPPLTDPVLAGQQTGASPSQRIGTVEINPIDLFSTIEQLTGDAIGQRQALIGDQGSLADPQAFLRSKDISIFGGSEASAAPSRLADYALAFPAAVLNRMLGQKTAPAAATVDPDMPYAFQRDPAYWDQLAKLDDNQLHLLARELAARYIDPARNSHLVDQLYSVFSKDRNTRVLGLTSGNDSIDYRAQVTAYGEAIGINPALAQPSGFAVLPVIGTQLAKALHATTGWVPDEAKLTDFWNGLKPESRLSYLSKAGFEQLGVDVISSLPLLSGLGTVLAVAKNAGGLASTAYRAYDLTLMTAKWTMAAGVASAVTNWGLEAAWPAYAESVGREVDLSRPVSHSAVAGIVNQIGYFSTSTLGVWPAAKVASAVLRRGVAAATGLADESLGSVGLGGLRIPHVAQYENQLFRDGLGGSAAAREAVAVGFHPQGLRTSVIGTIVSYAMNRREAEIVRSWAAAIRGRKTGIDAIDNARPEQREIMANDSLSRMRETVGNKTETDFRILQLRRQPRPVNPSHDDEQMREVIDRAGLGLEDDLAKNFVHDYGAPHLRDLAGEYTAPALERWVKQKTAELGFDPTQWGKHDTEGWAQRARMVYQYRFHAANGELFHAAEGSRESPRLSMFRQDSLFADVRDDALKVFESGDTAAAEARKLEILTRTREGRELFAEWLAPDGVEKTEANIKLSTVQRWLEDIGPALPVRRILPDASSMTAGLPLNAFHARLVDEGLWTLGFKPSNEAGEFVSYVRTRDGGVFKSPWLDYPIHQRDNIELGNRGWLAGKMDSITAGYRTWRIIEFQRGALFRRISSRFPGVSSAQIEALHQGVLDLSREHRINPQAVGTLPASATLVKGLTKDVDKLVERIFGKGPLRGADGKLHAVDWRHEIGVAYRQSLKLNLTSGLTSHLKSRFGGLGSAVALTSDVAYIEARFNMSPIFKGGEWWETAQFNAMNGLGVRPDPLNQAAFYRGGVGNDYGTIAEELTAEHMVQGAARGGLDLPRDSGARYAASMAFYARRLSSDLASDTSRAATHAAVDAIRTKEAMLDETIATIRRDGEALDPETGAPVGPDDIADLEARALHTREEKPDLPPLAQGDMEGLLKQLRDTLATEPSPAPAVPTPLQERLNIAVGENGVYPGLEERANEILNEMEHLQFALGDDGGPVFNFWGLSPEKQDAAVQKLVDAGYIFHGSSVHPASTDAKINAEAGFFTTDSFVDASWYAAKVPAGEWVRGRPPGNVYAIRKPHNIIDMRNPTPEQVTAIKAQVVKDAGDVLRQHEEGWPGPFPEGASPGQIRDIAIAGSSYAKKVAAVEKWSGFPTELSLESSLYDVAIHRSLYLKALSGDISAAWNSRYIAELMDSLGVDALKVKEPPMVGEGKTGDGSRMIDVWIFRKRPEVKSVEHAYADVQRQPSSADGLEDIAGTGEAVEQVVDDATRSRLGGWVKKAWNPVPWKLTQQDHLQMKLMADEFPALLRIAGADGGIKVFQGLKIPERQWASFLLEDRRLLDELGNATDDAGRKAAMAALLEHTGADARGEFDAMYASPAWDTITALWSLNAKATADEAFQVHFFSPYRSAFERSINHPLLGFYPASWAIKSARIWFKFLYDNQMFGELRLGMAPAEAINRISNAQQVAFAQTNDDTLEHFLRKGPLGSTIFIFNLMMPGDWSAIPFPASRSIREVLRGHFNPADMLTANLANPGLGVARDTRLISESLGELGNLLFGTPQKDRAKTIKAYSVRGDDTLYGEPRR